MVSTNIKKTVILLFLCFLAPLALLSACTDKTSIEDTSIDETKPLSGLDKTVEEEKKRIARFSEHVRREGDVLYLKLNPVSELSFKNLTECDRFDNCWYGFFQEYLADLDLYVVEVRLYEGLKYLLISGKSGRNYRMYAYPEVSPDRLHIVAVSEDEEGGGENSIHLWRIEQGELIEEFHYNTEKLGYYNLNSFSEWQDNSTVITNRFSIGSNLTPCPESNAFKARFALRKIGDAWKLDGNFVEGTINCPPWN
ncbi:MAG: hypothetical protein V3V95_04335 [Thermodesulfobacteriota bacterium]